MVTDKKRREVAQKLREFSRNTWQLTVGGNSATIRYAISDIVFGDKKYHSGVDLLDHLADLIDPPLQCPLYHSDRHYCSIYEDVEVVDRDDLLKLADELENSAIESSNWDVPFLNASEVMHMAHRIRRALE